jgi:tRNA(adenine34) deaminase
MKEIIELLIKEVNIAKNNDEIPVGAVIVDQNNNIIASGHNDRQNSYNVLGHAEINAIINAGKYIKDWRLDGYTMYVSLEPCEMCSYIIKESRLDKVLYFVNSENRNNNIVINKEQIDISKYWEIYNEFKDNIVDFFKEKR